MITATHTLLIPLRLSTFPCSSHSEGPPDHVPPLHQGAQRCGVSRAGDLDRSTRVQPSSSPRPGSPYRGKVSVGPNSLPEPPVWAGLHHLETAGQRATLPSPAPARSGCAPRRPGTTGSGGGEGKGGGDRYSRDYPPRRAQDRSLPQREGRQGGGEGERWGVADWQQLGVDRNTLNEISILTMRSITINLIIFY